MKDYPEESRSKAYVVTISPSLFTSKLDFFIKLGVVEVKDNSKGKLIRIRDEYKRSLDFCYAAASDLIRTLGYKSVDINQQGVLPFVSKMEPMMRIIAAPRIASVVYLLHEKREVQQKELLSVIPSSSFSRLKEFLLHFNVIEFSEYGSGHYRTVSAGSGIGVFMKFYRQVSGWLGLPQH